MIVPTTSTAPTLDQLANATAAALGAAGLILVTAVLPAEYGIDPTGAGKALGLTRTKTAAPVEPAAALAGAPLAASALGKSAQALRSDTMSVTLQPGEGTEVKASMRKGETFVFSWTAHGGPVKSDMHGEPHNAKPNEFTTFWKVPEQSAGAGSFAAPFDGVHGWFWRNKNDKPVTIKVNVSGFHDKLYRPATPG